MIKLGNRVSLFDNMGKEGVVIGHKKTKSHARTAWSTIPQAAWSNNIVIQWDDGSVSIHKPDAVMRID